MNENHENKHHILDSYITAPKLFGDLNLYKIGRSLCRLDAPTPDPLQGDYVKLTVITDGNGYLSLNGEEISIEPGDIFVSFSGEMHTIRSDEKSRLKYDFISFMPTSPTLASEIGFYKHAFHNASLRVINSKNVSDLVSAVIAELDAKDFEYDTVIASLLKQMSILLIREFRSTSVRETGSIAVGNASEAELLCYRIMNHIDLNLHSMRGLESLTNSFSYNYNYLSNLFKKTTGETLASYYKRKRLEAAHAMLSQDKVRITDVAISLGYSSVYTFSRAYKAAYDVSPKEAKRRMQSKGNFIIAEAELGHAELAVNASVGVFDFEK